MSDQANPRSPTELRVTAQLVALEAGTYCAFMTPGSPVADAASGLPAVRLSAAPGDGAGQVTVAGFGEQGWLAGQDDAVLLRVQGGPGRVLVTVYQGSDPAAEAPKLQMLRVSGAAAGTAAPAAAGPIEAMAHVYGRGDVGGRLGEWVGERGSRRWIEGFALQAEALRGGGGLEYQAVLGRGWLSPWVEAGQFCGSRGMSLPILGLHVRLTGPAADAYELAVWASFVDGTAIGPISGQPAEAPSLAALEAFQVSLTAKAPTEAAEEAKPAGRRRR